MTTRLCVYKDCHNFYCRKDNTACNDVTLFSFPKDPKRAEQWRTLGQVHPKIGTKQMFMCSKHFDMKYLSTSKNRTILVGLAVPNAYVKNEKQNELQQQLVPNSPSSSSSYTTKQSIYVQQRQVEPQQGSPTFYINLEDDQLCLENVVMVESTTTSSKDGPQPGMLDNNEIEVSIVPPSRKRAHSPSPSDSYDGSLEEPLSEDEQLIDASEVSIFRMKGEQYVQMSREYYLREKRQMMQQLHSYKHILSNIKLQLQSLDDI